MLFLARIGRPDILWSVNKLARAITQWTRACDKRLARLISKIHHKNNAGWDCGVGLGFTRVVEHGCRSVRRQENENEHERCGSAWER